MTQRLLKTHALFLAVFLAASGLVLVLPPYVKAQDASSTALKERIARLEQHILDMQGVIATLQSFVREGAGGQSQGGFPPAGGQAGSGGGGVPSEIGIRVLALETQIQALTGQMEQISQKLNQLPSGADAGVGGTMQQPGQQFGGAPALAPQAQSPGLGSQSNQSVPQFGITTTPAPANPFAQVMRDAPDAGTRPQVPAVPQQTAQLPSIPSLPAPGGGGARSMYDASYQNFLRNDLQAAEQGFGSFVKNFPDDPLTSNAYFWLGRTLFQRNNFEPAAKAFLAGYRRDKNSPIAPDSLFHLGMSLARMGEKDAACSTFAAVPNRYPAAPDKLKQDAAQELKRNRC